MQGNPNDTDDTSSMAEEELERRLNAELVAAITGRFDDLGLEVWVATEGQAIHTPPGTSAMVAMSSDAAYIISGALTELAELQEIAALFDALGGDAE